MSIKRDIRSALYPTVLLKELERASVTESTGWFSRREPFFPQDVIDSTVRTVDELTEAIYKAEINVGVSDE